MNIMKYKNEIKWEKFVCQTAKLIYKTAKFIIKKSNTISLQNS